MRYSAAKDFLIGLVLFASVGAAGVTVVRDLMEALNTRPVAATPAPGPFQPAPIGGTLVAAASDDGGE